MNKQELHNIILAECADAVKIIIDNYIKEDLGLLYFDEDYDMCYVVQDIFGELGGEVVTIIENEIEGEDY